MAENNVVILGQARFQIKRATLKEWQEENPVLRAGEPGAVIGLDEVGDGLEDETEKVKIGDGVTHWNDLGWWKGPKGDTGTGVGKFTEQGGEIFNSYEGEDLNQALDIGAHAEGRGTVAAKNAHAENRNTKALGNASHSEGNTTIASGDGGSHSEGMETEASGLHSHSQNYGTKAIADDTHAEGNTCTAGTKAFEIVGIDFTPKTEENKEETEGAVETYFVASVGSDENDGKTVDTPVTTIARAIELANMSGYAAGDTVSIMLIGESVDIGVLPTYTFDLIIDSNGLGTKTKIDLYNSKIIANNEGAKTIYKNVEINQPTTWSGIWLNGSNTIFSSDTKFSGRYNVLAFGSGTDDGEAKTVAGQTVVLNSNTPNFICLSNGNWSSKIYTEDVNLVLNNTLANSSIYFNTYYGGKPSGKTTFNKNVNIDIKNAAGIKFEQIENAFFEGALQIINSSSGIPIVFTTSGIADITAQKWILTNLSTLADALSFTETAGVYKVKEGYTVEAYHINGDLVKTVDGVLDLSGQSGEWAFDVVDATKFVGTITLDSVAGLEPKDVISIKAVSNQDFLLNAGTIETVNSETNTITVEGYPLQINRFLTAGKEYLFVLKKPTIGTTPLGTASNASGSNTKTIGTGSRTGGVGTIATGDYQVVCGTYNANKPDTIFELGCGTSDGNRTNAFEVYKDGTISIYGTKITRSNLRRLLELIG